MQKVLIRLANKQDLEALDKLYYDFHQYHARELSDRLQDLGRLEDQDWTRLHQAVEAILANKDAALFLAEDSGAIIGLVEVYVRQDEDANPLIVPHQYAYLQSIMVSKPHRRLGIGKKLMEAAQRWGRGKGATEMRLNVWEFNQGTIRFYEAMGYRSLKRTLVTEL